jgi:hypothetical protein
MGKQRGEREGGRERGRGIGVSRRWETVDDAGLEYGVRRREQPPRRRLHHLLAFDVAPAIK